MFMVKYFEKRKMQKAQQKDMKEEMEHAKRMEEQREAVANAFVESAKRGHDIAPTVARDMTPEEVQQQIIAERLQASGLQKERRDRGKAIGNL